MFDQLDDVADNAEALFRQLANSLVDAEKYHELFDARLAQCRQRLGLPADRTANLDDLPEPLRTQLEESYVAACREVGQLLIEAGRFRDAWTYLRPTGEKQLIREALQRAIPNDDNVEELIQVALEEGVAAERGLAWMLGHYGTCNSITAFEGLAGRLPPDDQRACAAVLVRHLHGELSENVRGHITREQGEPAIEESLTGLISERPWIFENDQYHVDTSHLAAVVRFARLLREPTALQLAVELTEYGRRLGQTLQYPGDPPFVDLYPSHRLLFLATLGSEIESAVDYFREQAQATSPSDDGTAPLETYLILLHRLGRHDEALATYGDLVPHDVALSPYAPTALELARAAGDWDRYLQIAQQRDDPVGYALGILEREKAGARST